VRLINCKAPSGHSIEGGSVGVGPREENVDLTVGVAIDDLCDYVAQIGVRFDIAELAVSISNATTAQCSPPNGEIVLARSRTRKEFPCVNRRLLSKSQFNSNATWLCGTN
jgi:hypothetical protein